MTEAGGTYKFFLKVGEGFRWGGKRIQIIFIKLSRYTKSFSITDMIKHNMLDVPKNRTFSSDNKSAHFYWISFKIPVQSFGTEKSIYKNSLYHGMDKETLTVSLMSSYKVIYVSDATHGIWQTIMSALHSCRNVQTKKY